MTDKLDMTSPNLVSQNIEKIAALFPNCVTESANGLAIDFDMLKQELSKDIVEGNKERYRLEWPGKREAIVTANLPINKTLRPAREESVDFDNTENLYIEGDNLEVLKLLQESYLSKIKMIYIDPPYNTGEDFIYKDNYTQNSEVYQEEAGLKDEYNNRLVANPDTSGRYHSDWLTMMYPRLKLARNLLTDDGVIFISIDNNEVSNLISISNEIFGESSFITVLHVEMSSVQGQKVKAAKAGNIVKNAEYILVYSKNGLKNICSNVLYKPQEYDTHYSIFLKKIDDNLFEELSLGSIICENKILFDKLKDLGFAEEKLGIKKISNNNISKAYGLIPELREFIHINSEFIAADDKTTGLNIPNSLKLKQGFSTFYNTDNRSYYLSINSNGNIRQRLILKEKVQFANDFNNTFGVTTIRGDWWPEYYRDMGNVSKEGDMKYENGKKPVRLIRDLIHSVIKPNDIVLDFFAGSSTTAHSVLDYNSKFTVNCKYILVQVPEFISDKEEHYKNGFKTICDIGKERIRRAATKIREEKWSKIQKDAQKEGKITHINYFDDQDYGFRVYKLDSSNMQDVYYTPKEFTQDLLSVLEDNIKPDRNSDDLVAQIMLDWGLPLSLKIEQTKIANKEVFKVAGDALLCCFDEGIDEAFAKEIATLKPLRIVFRDKSFKDDTAKENVKQLLKQLSPDSEMKVI